MKKTSPQIMIKFQRIPFYIVVLAFFLAWLAEVSQIYTLNYIPDMVAIAIFLPLLVARRLSLPRKVYLFLIPVFSAIVVVVAFSLSSGRSLTSGSGFIGLAVLTVIFLALLHQDKSPDQVNNIAKQVGLIYVFHIGYIAIETAVLMLNGFDLIKAFIPGYRYLSGQPVYDFFGLDNPGAANGIMFGPQVASQMLILAIFWLAPIYKGGIRWAGRANRWPWVIAILLFPFCMTGTAVLMFLVMALGVLLFLPNVLMSKWLTRMRYFVLMGFVIAALSGVLGSALMYRVPTEYLLNYYLFIFLDPVQAFMELPPESMWLGMQTDFSLLRYTDFGFGAMVWSGGLLIALTATISFCILMARVFVLLHNKAARRLQEFLRWGALAAASSINAIGWATSTSHYTVATETGGKQLFALLIAVSLLSVIRLQHVRLGLTRT